MTSHASLILVTYTTHILILVTFCLFLETFTTRVLYLAMTHGLILVTTKCINGNLSLDLIVYRSFTEQGASMLQNLVNTFLSDKFYN